MKSEMDSVLSRFTKVHHLGALPVFWPPHSARKPQIGHVPVQYVYFAAQKPVGRNLWFSASFFYVPVGRACGGVVAVRAVPCAQGRAGRPLLSHRTQRPSGMPSAKFRPKQTLMGICASGPVAFFGRPCAQAPAEVVWP